MKLALPAPQRAAKTLAQMRLGFGIAALTLVVAGAGAFVGTQLAGQIENAVAKRIENAPPSVEVKEAYRGGATLRKLAPIVTNLASPKDTWVRLEAGLVLDAGAKDNPDLMVSAITEDMLLYLRTLTAPQLEGAAGLRYLREDLGERVKVRSKGLVRDIVIETLVVQ